MDDCVEWIDTLRAERAALDGEGDMTEDLRARVRRVQEAAAALLDAADRLMADIDALTDPPSGSTVLTGISDPMVTVAGTCPRCELPFTGQFREPAAGEPIVFLCGCGHEVRFPTVKPLHLLVNTFADSKPRWAGGSGYLRRADWDDGRADDHLGRDGA